MFFKWIYNDFVKKDETLSERVTSQREQPAEFWELVSWQDILIFISATNSTNHLGLLVNPTDVLFYFLSLSTILKKDKAPSQRTAKDVHIHRALKTAVLKPSASWSDHSRHDYTGKLCFMFTGVTLEERLVKLPTGTGVRGLTMGVLYLWITTSLVSGTMPVQETKQTIQRQQEHKWVTVRELGGGV